MERLKLDSSNFANRQNISRASFGMTNCPMGVVTDYGRVTFLILAHNQIFGIDEAGHFKCRVLTDTKY